MLIDPPLGRTTLTLLGIGFVVVSGLLQLGWASTGGEGNQAWLAIGGAVALLPAILLWVDFPASALRAVGVRFGVNFLDPPGPRSPRRRRHVRGRRSGSSRVATN